jgi:hypothetical protein
MNTILLTSFLFISGLPISSHFTFSSPVFHLCIQTTHIKFLTNFLKIPKLKNILVIMIKARFVGYQSPYFATLFFTE